jgi:histidine triad (HIT) family protein
MTDTIFSKIIRREIPAKIAFESENVLAFHDVNPQAPIHILVIPKKPLSDIASAGAEDRELLGELLLVAGNLAKELNLGKEGGFRLVINNGAAAGQTVFHLHVHLLGGRVFNWPPG